MSLLSQITCGKRPAPRRCMIHGVQGVGKSTWAATSDRPIFIQTEDGLGEIDCAKFPVARGFADVMAALTELRSEAHDFRTVVVDSLDWLERLIWQEVCVRKNVKNIEDIGFQKGYVFALDEWRMVIEALDALRRDRGMAIILIAHTKIVGGGESTTATFPGSALKAGGDYAFFCSFPGHWAIMKGKLVVR